MRVALGAFACAGITAHIGGDITAAVEKAAFHYASRLKADRPPIGLPRFADGPGPEGPEQVIELELASEVEDLLAAEARRQGVAVEQLVAHAVLVYLAELDFLEAPPGS